MEFVYYILFAVGGMVVHFLKKQVKDGEESLSVIFKYFSVHAISSIITVVSVFLTITIFYFQMPDELTYLSSVGIGYAGDSAINKWVKK